MKISVKITVTNQGDLEDLMNYLVNTNDSVSYDKGELLNDLCREGYVEMVESLLRKGADPNIYNCCSTPPLVTACKYGHVDVAEALLNAGADPNIYNSSECITPLIISSIKGYVEMVELLLRKGADPNLVVLSCSLSPPEPTTLERAAEKPHLKIMELILQAGFNTHSAAFYKTLGMAYKIKDAEMIELLEKFNK